MRISPARIWTRLVSSANAADRRLRPDLWPAVQASVAATVAWYLANDVLGYPQPIFAPIAAAVSLGASRVMRGHRALQLISGVTLGIGIGIGVGALAGSGALALGLAVLSSMCVAVAVGSGFTGNGAMFINQTSVSAILVIALQLSDSGLQRLIEAWVGGGVALVIAVLLFPAAPLPLVRETTQGVFIALRDALDHLDQLVSGRRPLDPTWTLAAGQRIIEQLAALLGARGTASEIVRLAPRWWRARAALRTAEERSAQLNLLANAVLSLLRIATEALVTEPDLPDQLRRAIHELTVALGALAEDGDAGAAEAVASAALADQLAREEFGSTTNPALIASIIRASSRDVSRVVGAEPVQP